MQLVQPHRRNTARRSTGGRSSLPARNPRTTISPRVVRYGGGTPRPRRSVVDIPRRDTRLNVGKTTRLYYVQVISPHPSFRLHDLRVVIPSRKVFRCSGDQSSIDVGTRNPPTGNPLPPPLKTPPLYRVGVARVDAVQTHPRSDQRRGHLAAAAL
jgi:hypothetical protein